MINTTNKKFRYDINALRAIAILGVLLFHYKIKYFYGGFAGVDVFFVISGYLMSRIIITSINNNKFAFTDFYAKRVKRIVPALLFIILVVTIAGFFIYFPDEYQQNETNASVSNIFISNIFYWKHSNYFDPASGTNIFLHTWSLSVEWQFYLIYPVFLLILNRLFKNRIYYNIIFLILTVLFLAVSVYSTSLHPSLSFYLLHTRAWEMLFGGVAFLFEDKVSNKLIRYVLAIVGYISIFASFVLFNDSMAWPGLLTLIPVVAAFLIIISNINEFKILKSGVIQFIGKISYSLYLWHWPIFVTAQYLGFSQTVGVIALLMGISVGCAYFSYRYIESVEFDTKKILTVMVVFLAFTSVLSYIDCNHILFKPKALAIADYKKDNSKALDEQFSDGGCFISSKQIGLKDLNKQNCLNIEKGKKNFLLIGDSHAADLSSSLKELFEKDNINLMEATSSGCLPILKNNGESRCRQVINYIYNSFIVDNAKDIDGVIISAQWLNTTEAESQYLSDEINSTVTYIKKYHIRTIIIGQSETFNIPYASIEARQYQYNVQIVNNYLNKNAYKLNQLLSSRLTAIYIDIYNNKIPGLSPNNVPYMFDSNHFTKYGADLAAKKIFSNSIFKNFIKGGIR